MQRGFFIVLEGPDGAGTTFHSAALAERLRREGFRVLCTAEPTASPIGTEIRRCISGHSPPPPQTLQLLFAADRALHVAETIAPALADGMTVICDRYIPSTLAYGEAAGADSAWLRDLNKYFVQPDVTLYLLPPLSVCLQRLAARSARDALESALFQERVYDAYRKLLTEDARGERIDSADAKDIVTQRVWAAVQKALPAKVPA